MSERIQNNFYGGMADSIRDPSLFKFDIAKHFDIFSDPKRLIPYKNVLADNTGVISTVNEIGNFLVNGRNAYALGRDSSSDLTRIFDNGGTSFAWENTGSAVASSAGQARAQKLFIKFKNVIYGKRGNFIWSYNLGTDTFNESEHATGTGTASMACNGIVGKANGYLYIPILNTLHYFDGSSWGTALLTIPSDETIIGLANYGSYLAVLTDKSYIYIWDFASTFASEIVELDEGSYTVLGSIKGALIAVGQKTTPTGSELVISQYTGGDPETIFRKVLPSTVSVVSGVVRLKYGKMFFAVNDTASDRKYQGIWAIGKHASAYPLAVTIAFDYIESGGTAANIVNFDLDTTDIFICTDDWKLHKITSLGSYATVSPISFVEFTKISTDADLKAVYANFSPLPSGGIAKIKYLRDAETLFTQIAQETTQNALSKKSVNIEPQALTATITIATPAVITATNHGFRANQAVVFTTSGALPTGITTGTTYYVLSTGLTVNTFKISATEGGSAINTSGSQSGTHTVTSAQESLSAYEEVQFRLESLGGAEFTEFGERSEETDNIYASA